MTTKKNTKTTDHNYRVGDYVSFMLYDTMYAGDIVSFVGKNNNAVNISIDNGVEILIGVEDIVEYRTHARKR